MLVILAYCCFFGCVLMNFKTLNSSSSRSDIEITCLRSFVTINQLLILSLLKSHKLAYFRSNLFIFYNIILYIEIDLTPKFNFEISQWIMYNEFKIYYQIIRMIDKTRSPKSMTINYEWMNGWIKECMNE